DMNQTSLQKQITVLHYDRKTLERVQPLLPADDAELDALIEELLSDDDRVGFRFVVLAALAANRPVDAKYLVGGASILIERALLSVTALRMRGDVANYLLKAVNTGPFDNRQIANIIFLIAVWCREFGSAEFPVELFPKTRELLRLHDLTAGVIGLLLTIALYTNDEGLLTILRKQHFPGRPQHRWEEARTRVLAAARDLADMNRGPLVDNLPEKGKVWIASGTTMRRAVPRFGRNEPCRCGSGRKYKRCCLENDNSRLRRSTDIAGVTLDEIGHVAEHVFTPSRMEIAT